MSLLGAYIMRTIRVHTIHTTYPIYSRLKIADIIVACSPLVDAVPEEHGERGEVGFTPAQ